MDPRFDFGAKICIGKVHAKLCLQEYAYWRTWIKLALMQIKRVQSTIVVPPGPTHRTLALRLRPTSDSAHHGCQVVSVITSERNVMRSVVRNVTVSTIVNINRLVFIREKINKTTRKRSVAIIASRYNLLVREKNRGRFS